MSESRAVHKRLHLQKFNTKMQTGSSESAYKIEHQEFFGPYIVFNDHSKHDKRVHIEEYVPEATVHEHVRHHLPPMKER